MTEQYVEELIGKYADGIATEEEVQKLMDWWRMSPGESVWPSSETDEKQKVYHRMLDRLENKISPKHSRLVYLPWMKIAAMLVIFLGAATMVYILRPFSNAYITVTNPSGKIQMVGLPDSSKIWLNASTTVRYPESFKNNRKIELEGETYFEVTHDVEHPFMVTAGDLQTTVLGTSFNIKAYPSADKTTISVITGKVKVDNNSKELARLTPSAQLAYDKKNKTATIATIDASTILAWKNGKLHFAGQTLSEIAATLERWYVVSIVFTSPEIGNCRYYMSFDNSISLEKLMLTMSELTEMEYSIDKNTITISGTKCQ